MNKREMKILLILGCRRSGTTLLASLMGAHSKINMINEGCYGEFEHLIGKPYQGVKLAIPHIAWSRRYSGLHRWIYRKTRWLPFNIDMPQGSKYSVEDFIKMNAYILFIYRNTEDNINSIVNRSKTTKRKAKKSVMESQKIQSLIESVPRTKIISLENLTSNPQRELKNICKWLDIPFEYDMIHASGMNNTYKNSIIEKKT